MQIIPASVFLLTLLLHPRKPALSGGARPRRRGRRGADAPVRRRPRRARKVAEIRGSLAADHAPRLSDLHRPQDRRLRPIVWVGVGLATFQQLVGINVVFYYGAVLWQAVGFSEADSLKINILSGTLSIAACLVAIVLIDRIGRKPLLLIGSIGMAMTLATLTIASPPAMLSDGTLHWRPRIGMIALVSANVYVIFFNLSWGPVMWVMLGEMFPNQIRGSGLAVGGCGAVDRQFPDQREFSGDCRRARVCPSPTASTRPVRVVSIFFVLQMVHETRGRELEDMVG